MYGSIDEANQAITEIISSGQPILLDVVRAREVIDVLAAGHKKYSPRRPADHLRGDAPPMQGSCVGTVLFEKWAPNEELARELLTREVIFLSLSPPQRGWPDGRGKEPEHGSRRRREPAARE